MNDLNNIFSKRLEKLGLKKQVEASLVVEEAQKRLEKIFGKKVEGNLKVVSFKNGVLKIAAKNSVWAGECRMREEQVKNKQINRILFVISIIDY